MRRWDVLAVFSGAMAVLGFSLLIAVMVNRELASLSAAAYLALGIGTFGVIAGTLGMSRQMAVDDVLDESNSGLLSMSRLNMYRQLQRPRD